MDSELEVIPDDWFEKELARLAEEENEKFSNLIKDSKRQKIIFEKPVIAWHSEIKTKELPFQHAITGASTKDMQYSWANEGQLFRTLVRYIIHNGNETATTGATLEEQASRFKERNRHRRED